MADLIRDTALGVVLRFVTRNRVLQYPEEKADFKLPEVWVDLLKNGSVDEDGKAAGRAVSVDRQSMVDASAAGRLAAISASVSASSDEEKAEPAAGGIIISDDHADEAPYAGLRRASTAASATPGAGAAFQGHRTRSREETLPFTDERLAVDELHQAQRTQSIPVVPRLTRTQTRTQVRTGADGAKTGSGGQAADDTTAIVVDWYATDDPANPQNWTRTRRIGITVLIALYTFVVYTASAIYTPSEQGVMETFGVDATHAALGLSMFVLGYGVGPLLFSPLSEIPAIGRNPVYAVTILLYIAVSLPTALAYGNHPGGGSSGSFAGLIVLRFLQGFFGSPCLAAGAATLGDIFSLMQLPFALVAWVCAAFCGPALGPLLSGYSVPAKGWHWSQLEVLWAAAPVTVLMLALLPETSAENILLRRARRLRHVTGSDRFRAPSEVAEVEAAAAAATAAGHALSRRRRLATVVGQALIKPFEITLKDPAILFVQIYSSIVYGIYYSFFEAFPIVYAGSYGMTSGQIGLVFLCVLVACTLGAAIYCSYLAFYLNPRIRASGRFPVAESRLVPAMVAAFGPTIGLFIFAWTANSAPSVPWIAPTIGITLYGTSVFVVTQCIFVYVPLSYPQYAASLFAANDFCRAALACGAVLFGRPLYINLGIGRGTTLLAGLSTIGIIGVWLLYFYGARLRALSKFAVKN